MHPATRASRRNPTRLLLSLGLALAALAPAGAASADEPRPIARPSHGAAAIEWRPLGEDDGMVLTVSLPDGRVVRQEFAAGTTPTFGLFDRAGNALPDGGYTWELRAVPRLSPEVQAALARARETGDDGAVEVLRAAGQLPAPRLQWGRFAIQGGALVNPDLEEPQAAATPAPDAPPRQPGLALRDYVVADDLIVEGSSCLGLDCASGENFSFDTVRIKENNARLVFMDTSNTSFPDEDWQLRANDAGAGGDGLFAVDYLGDSAADGDTPVTTPLTIEAGAPDHAVFVDSTGRVGFRTSTPVVDLHVKTDNTPALRLEQDGSGGFTAQTWDVGGNEASFFVRDVTGGSRLPLRIRPGAPTSSIDVADDGDVGIGTASPATRLNVNGGEVQVDIGAVNGGVVINSATDGVLPQLTLAEVTRTWRFRVSNNGDFVFTDATAGISPFRVVGNALASDRLVIVNDGVNVTGTLRVNGTTMTVPDYVFAPEYRLMPLDELAAFVAEKRHLPGVPNAEEVQAGGLDLSRFPLQLLAKIEELTLYTLDQHLTIERLEARLAQLEAASGR